MAQQEDRPGSQARRELFAFAWRYRKRYALGVLALLLTDILELATPAIIAIVIDSLGEGWQAEGFQAWIISFTGVDYALLTAVLVGVVLVQCVLRYFWRVGFVFTSMFIARDVRKRLFEKLTELPPRFYDSSQTGDLMSRASNDVDAVRMFLGIGTLLLADTAFYFLFVPALLVTWSPKLTLWLLIGLPAVPFIARSLSLAIHARFGKVQEQLSTLSAHAQESFAGVDVVRSFSREEAENRRFAEHSMEYQRRTLDLWSVQMWLSPLMVLVVAVEEFIVIIVGGGEVMSGALSPGQFVAFFFYLVMLTWPMEGLGWVLSLYQRGMASYARLKEVFDEPVEIADGEGGHEVTEGALEFVGVGLTHGRTENPALADIDLVVPAGSTLAIVGSVGAGKTTLASLVPRSRDPDSGSVLIDGVDLRRFELKQLRRAVGYVPQETFLFSATMAENMALGAPDADRASLERVAALVALERDLAEMPQGLDTVVGEKGVTLSGGQRQRVALARALLINPKILLLDDCMSAVDTRTEGEILTSLAGVRAGRTTLVISHRLTSVTDADEIIVLEQGRIADRGNHAQLVARGGWYAETHAKQLLERRLDEEET